MHSTTYIAKDLTNQRFGMLTAINRTDEKAADGSYIWMLRCDCGTIVKYSQPSRKFSCGCTARFNSGRKTPIDFSSYRNQMATAIKQTDERCPHTGNVIWEMKCDCGVTFFRPSYCITRKTCTSCGCTKFMPTGRPRLKDNMAYVNSIFSSYKKGARERKLEFCLTIDQCRSLFESRCHYCNENPRQRKRGNLSGEWSWNGIDRKMPKIGYTTENSVPCCARCNFSKGTMEYSEFIKWIKKVYRHLNP